MNNILCIGGPHDATIQETEVSLTVQLAEPQKIPVVTEDGLIKHYLVVFLTGAKIKFPIAVWEDMTPDDVFKNLLNWYTAKSIVLKKKEPTTSET
jgi:hypothetical protein